jgi:hypothetical protein
MNFLLTLFTGGISGYFKTAIYIVLVCGIFFAGWHTRDRDFTIYKDQVRIEAEKQAAHVESIQKQQEITTKGISDEYNAKLALLRQYYANGVRNNNGPSTVSGISSTSKLSDAIAAYNQLAADCAATTLQTVTLQQWITEQMAIK